MSQNKTPSIPNPLLEASVVQNAQAQANYVPQTENTADLERRVTALENKRTNLNTDIIGLFEVVSAVPTGVPHSAYDQVKIYHSGTTRTLYLYDYSEGRWDSVGLS